MTTTFNVLTADPPWQERGGGKIKRGAQRHYPLVAAKDLPDIMTSSPLWRPAPDALLWLWATTSHLEDALGFIPQLGFRRCAAWVWAKVDGDADGFIASARLGLGQWSRVEHEHLLLARRGDVKVPPPSARQRSVIFAPRRAHSEKPDEAWHVIETTSRASLGEVRGAELFARTARPGWEAWGNEIPEPDEDTTCLR